MSDIREHPDYALGYEDGWYRSPRRCGASAEYSAGYEAALKVGKIFEAAGMQRIRGGIYSISGRVGGRLP